MFTFQALFVAESQCGAGPICKVGVFVFLPIEENQCGRITRNIERTRPGLTKVKLLVLKWRNFCIWVGLARSLFSLKCQSVDSAQAPTYNCARYIRT